MPFITRTFFQRDVSPKKSNDIQPASFFMANWASFVLIR